MQPWIRCECYFHLRLTNAFRVLYVIVGRMVGGTRDPRSGKSQPGGVQPREDGRVSSPLSGPWGNERAVRISTLITLLRAYGQLLESVFSVLYITKWRSPAVALASCYYVV